jgi:aarF domain-containing kinase
MVADLLGIFPRGLYLDELIKVTRHELHWETDYQREADYQTRYRNACAISPEKYYAPEVIAHLSNKEILCSEFVEGVEIDTFRNESQEVRDRIGSLMLELTFRELFEWGVM